MQVDDTKGRKKEKGEGRSWKKRRGIKSRRSRLGERGGEEEEEEREEGEEEEKEEG